VDFNRGLFSFKKKHEQEERALSESDRAILSEALYKGTPCIPFIPINALQQSLTVLKPEGLQGYFIARIPALYPDGSIKHKAGYRMRNIAAYRPGEEYRFRIEAWTANRFYDVYLNGNKETSGLFYSPVHSLERITFRTGGIRRFPDTDTPTDQDYDMEQDGRPVREAVYYIKYLNTGPL